MTDAPSRWRDLFRLAVAALDEVYGLSRDDDWPDWTLGGGTAIAVRIDHRISYDVDAFIQHGRLKDLTPAVNTAAARISEVFQWPGHYLKFELPYGEIDFLSAPLQTRPGFDRYDIDGRTIALETPEEVIVKKARYRSDRFTARDVFDLAAVAVARPGLAEILAAEVPDTLARMQENIRLHELRGLDHLAAQINPTSFGLTLLPGTFVTAATVVRNAIAL